MFRRLRFDLRYWFHAPWDTGVSPPELIAYLKSHRPARAIDLGCGTGMNVLTLFQYGWRVTGVDVSAKAISLAHERLAQAGAGATLRVLDLGRTCDLGGPYDFALDIGCLHSIRQRLTYCENLSVALRPGADYLLYAFLKAPGVRAGLRSEDLLLLAAHGLGLVHREDGRDPSGRPSAWFQFEKAHERNPRPDPGSTAS